MEEQMGGESGRGVKVEVKWENGMEGLILSKPPEFFRAGFNASSIHRPFQMHTLSNHQIIL